jgi:protein SCO1/2
MRTTILLLLAAACAPAPPPLPPPPALAQVPPFRFVECRGGTLDREALLGRVWVASFIFTRCTSICVPMCAEMRELQDDLADEPAFAIVSVTVDPANDTPEVLKDFARVQEAAKDRWYFVTGTKEEIRAFSHDGLKVPGHPDDMLLHSDYFVLVDREGAIRGYYRQSERERMEKLRQDVRALLGGKA